MHLKVSYEDGPDDITVVRVEGDGQGGVLDAASAPALRSTLLEVIESGRLILVVDLSAVDCVDRAVLYALIGGLTRVRVQGGTLALAVMSQQVREFLTGTRWGEAIRTYETVASAVTALTAAYAERSVEQRRAAIAGEASRIAPLGGYSYEHVSEYVTVVTLKDEVDCYTAPALRKLLVDLVNHGRVFLVMDMTDVEFLDSTGIMVVVGALKRVRAHDGAMALVVPGERVQKICRITGLVKVFPIFDAVDPAVEFLGREFGGHG